ncbi:putative ribonuclease H-like domain-containing protein, partial [Tanacetum coccineum]
MSAEEPAPQMTPIESPQMVSTVKLLMLKKGEYTLWSMRMEQYLTNTDYIPPKTAQAILARQRERIAKSILLLAIPDEYQLRFHAINDANTLWAAIKSRFGGNVESKKMQKNVLKQHFENFSVSDTEGLDKAYDRFQKLISLLEVHGVAVSNEDANQKFLRALPSSWNNIALIMRNRDGIDDMDIDDLYNNLKVFEADIKGSFGSSSNSQNVAFLSAEDTSSSNEVNTANGVSTTAGHSSQGQASYADELMFSFFANQSNIPQLDDEDLEQIDHDDLEEIDLKWQVAMLSIRVKRFYKNTGRKLNFNSKEPVGFDKTKDNALILQDGLGYDWSYMTQDEPTEFALMSYTSSPPAYQLGLESIEVQIIIHQKNEVVYEEKIAILEFEVKDKDNAITRLKNQLDETLREKDDLKAKLEQFETSSKNLNKLINSQLSAKDKTGLGYGDQMNENDSSGSELFNSVFDSHSSDGDDNQTNDRFKKGDGYHEVPPPFTGNYMPPLANLSFVGLDDSVYRPTTNKTSASVSKVEASVSQTSTISVEMPKAKFVRSSEVLIEEWFTNAKNEPVKFDKQADKPRMFTQNPKGSDFHEKRMAKKSVLKDMGKGTGHREVRPVWNNAQKINHQNKFVPSAVLTRSERVPVSVVKQSSPKSAGSSTSAAQTRISNEKVNVVRVNGVNTAAQKAVSVVKGNGVTANKDFLTGYQEIDGGFVAFGGSTRGGKITGKGKIRTSKLDFEDVYFVKELKFNLFSVSQMCDKKNSVLFTETECLVLSPDFMILDESQVLLRVPRQNNMYSFDLKNIVPVGDLTCLPSKIFENDHICIACQKGKQHKTSCKVKPVSTISQPLQILHMDLFGPTSVRSINHKTYCLVVTDDFSRFSWVFFLATKDETSGILKRFITEIENQLNHKVKAIRCDNGTEFKNREMNEFCRVKGIKREFSVSRTPQQNGVTERNNRTLIKAARTMLLDSLLPITFWAEVVNTTCYVLNRVLVIKPHNKTPYELLFGIPPSISFMRPFGCPVTILNTLDPLGKFDGKTDEGFLVGYSVNSKAFRVFNSKTRKVEENMHVNFLENKPNVAGQGPNWIFDIDSLTNSMNYQPVTAGNQTNKNAGPQETNSDTGLKKNVDAGQTGKENSSDEKDGDDTANDAAGKNTIKEPASEDEQAMRYTLDKMLNQEKEASKQSNAIIKEFEAECDRELLHRKAPRASSINSFNNVSTPVNAANAFRGVNAASESGIFNVVGSSFVPLGGSFSIDATNLPDDPLMPDLEDTTEVQSTGIFGNAYDNDVLDNYNTPYADHVVGAEADFNNMEPSIVVSPIPTTRIHSIHPKDQIIGDPKSAVQTRGMTKKSSGEQAMISYILKQQRTNHKNYQNCLFACFLSQLEPKKVTQALDDESWVEAMQEELLQFKLLNVWTLVDLPYGKRAIGTKQEEGIDYDEVFTLVARIEVIRLFLAYASFMDFTMYQMDVKSAFLYGTIEEEVEQRKDGIFLSQDKYVCDILKKFGFSSVKSARTPMETRKTLSKDANGTDVYVHLYRSMIGSLMYLTSSKPDIMFVVCACLRFQVQPKTSHMHAVNRIFRYLKGQPRCQFGQKSQLEWLSISCSRYRGLYTNELLRSFVVRDKLLELYLELQGYLINEGYADLVRMLVTLFILLMFHMIGLHHITNGHQFTMVNRPRKIGYSRNTTTGKEFSIRWGLGMDTGGSPRRQETMGVLLLRLGLREYLNSLMNHLSQKVTHLEVGERRWKQKLLNSTDNVPPTPYDSPLTGGFTTWEVLDWKNEKMLQVWKISTLKRRVKNWKDKRKSKTSHTQDKRTTEQVETSSLWNDVDIGGSIHTGERRSDKLKPMFKYKDFEELDDHRKLLIKRRRQLMLLQWLVTVSAPISIAGVTISTDEPRTSSTTTTAFDDEDATMAMAQTLIKMKEQKAKEKGSIKERQKQEEATNAALAEEFDEIQARIDADHELAVRLTHEEQEKYIIKERARLLAKLFKRRKKQLAAERAEAIRNKPPTRTQKLYQKEQKWIDDFKPMDDDSQQQAKSTKMRPRADSEEESSKKQKLEEEDDAEKEELRASMDVVPRDDVAIDVESLATKYPIVDWKIHILNENMMYYQIIKADGSS